MSCRNKKKEEEDEEEERRRGGEVQMIRAKAEERVVNSYISMYEFYI